MADPVDPDAVPDDAQQPEKWDEVGQQLLAAFSGVYTQDKAKNVIAGGMLSAVGASYKVLYKNLVQLAVLTGKGVHEAEEQVLPILAAFVAPMVAGLFGGEIDSSAFATRAASDGRQAAARAIVDAVLQQLQGDTVGALEPSMDGSRRVAAAAMNATLEGWFQGAIPELLADCVPWPIGRFEPLLKLPEDVIRSLGIGRLVRRALSPLIDAVAAEPMRWKVNKDYTPKLLSASTVLRQFTRGRWDWADVEEELARDGYSAERIDALLSEQIKRMSIDDLTWLFWNELVGLDEVIATMREEGYDEQTASKHVNAQNIKHEDAIRRTVANDAIAAYIDRRIDDGQLANLLGDAITAQHERDLLVSAARGRRALNTKVMTPAQVASCVKVGILAVADYRASLAQDGYLEPDITSLELLLRHELDAKAEIETLRAQQAADKAAALAARQQLADQKRQELAAAQALKRRGSLTELEHAVVLGLIPISRLEEVLNASYDADTVGIYVADVEQQRAAYVADQQKRDDAAKRAAVKGLNVGQLEAAVYAGVLTVDQFASAVRASGLAADDVDILARTVAAKLADLTAAKQARADASTRAKQQQVPLTTIEQLVLRGLRPMTAYDQALTDLGFDDAQRAAMRELLQARIDERADAAAVREQQKQKDTSRGLSLEQFRKAVIAGTRTIDQFQAYLVANKYTADAVAVLVDELQSDVDAAAAAQQRRDQADAASGRAGVAVTTAARAARLGVITPDAYQAALEAAGYSQDDIALELELLVAEMATAKSNQKLAAATATPTSAHGLTLAQIASAVKAGAATRADYISAAGAAGLSDDAIATLTAQLDDELAAIADAKSRRQQIVPALLAAGVDLADLENQVRARSITVEQFEQQLEALNYSEADAQLVGSLLETELADGR
ncbi:MAG TPA: hypothetical protein VJN96_09185 [Vicinamibacterales bacterium]|nr:hypothetical protein [Vicinamibacterales bacterium]